LIFEKNDRLDKDYEENFNIELEKVNLSKEKPPLNPSEVLLWVNKGN
jgi:hypothetical protein